MDIPPLSMNSQRLVMHSPSERTRPIFYDSAIRRPGTVRILFRVLGWISIAEGLHYPPSLEFLQKGSGVDLIYYYFLLSLVALDSKVAKLFITVPLRSLDIVGREPAYSLPNTASAGFPNDV